MTRGICVGSHTLPTAWVSITQPLSHPTSGGGAPSASMHPTVVCRGGSLKSQRVLMVYMLPCMG